MNWSNMLYMTCGNQNFQLFYFILQTCYKEKYSKKSIMGIKMKN